MVSMRALASASTIFSALLFQIATWGLTSAACGVCSTCVDVFTFWSSFQITAPQCDFGQHPYIKRIELDSQSDTFSYRTLDSKTGGEFSACSDGDELCHATDTDTCGFSGDVNPVVEVTCRNWITRCKVSYGVSFGCSCQSCSGCSTVSPFTGNYDVVVRPGSCKSNQYWYITSVQIDSPSGDLFTYVTYADPTLDWYYSACSNAKTPVCSASVRDAACGKGMNDMPFLRITCENSNGKSCNLRAMMYYTCADLPAGTVLPPATTAPPPTTTPAWTAARSTPTPTPSPNWYWTPQPAPTPSPTTAPAPTPSPTTAPLSLYASGSVQCARDVVVCMIVTALAGLALFMNAVRVNAPVET